tara:strand:- start:914 stop:1996 length:1083 start_codon:yes stop_codon:yes gene_type:complete
MNSEIDKLIQNTLNDSKGEWDESYEKILIEMADKGQCFRWLHSKSYNMYRNRAMWFTIPVIIMSTITGTANFAQDRFDDNHEHIAVMTIGAINIFAGILTTVSQYLKVNELLESHRVASITWSKFSRDIKMELAKHPDQRSKPLIALKNCQEEFDRLMEVSPNIEDNIIDEFNKKFDEEKLELKDAIKRRNNRILHHPESGVPVCCRFFVKRLNLYDCFRDPINEDEDIESGIELKNNISNLGKKINIDIERKNKFSIARPEICDKIISVEEFVHPWKKNKLKEEEIINDNKKLSEINRLNLDEKLNIQHKNKVFSRINNFISEFQSKMKRDPMFEEIKDNLSDLDEEDIKDYHNRTEAV